MRYKEGGVTMVVVEEEGCEWGREEGRWRWWRRKAIGKRG